MYNINQLINETKNMPNVSVGGSACYDFGDVVLVKYKNSREYGIARPEEEIVAKYVNKKNSEGVNTPKHLLIKREVVGNDDICWVLQEKAKGISYTHYCRDDDPTKQLNNQIKITNLDDIHYKQLAFDLKELMHAGIELKPKNIYFDEKSKTGAFTIIDLLGDRHNHEISKFKGDLIDCNKLYNYVTNVLGLTFLSPYNEKATKQQIEKSKELLYIQQYKTFKTLLENVPEFKENARWIARSLSKETLLYFNDNGLNIQDLTLTIEEEERFAELCNNIVEESINKIKSGNYKYWQIESNENRICIKENLLVDAYKYSLNCKLTREKTEEEWLYEVRLQEHLEKVILKDINKRLKELYNSKDKNNYIVEAYKDSIANGLTI